MTTESSTDGNITNNHDQCLICGQSNPRSFKLKYRSTGEHSVGACLTTCGHMQGYRGILHGGVIAALLDSAMTHCLFQSGITAFTVDLKVRYVRPIPCGKDVAITAWLETSHDMIYCLQSRIFYKDDLMARARGKFMTRALPSLELGCGGF